MRIAGVLVFLTVSLISLAQAGQGAKAVVEKDQPEWQGVKFGIDENTLFHSGKDLTKFEETQIIKGATMFSNYKIDDYSVVGMPARVDFYFGEESRTLEMVYVSLKDLTRVDGALKCLNLEGALSQKYGAPVHRSDKTSSFARGIDTKWASGNLNISLRCTVGGWVNQVIIKYSPSNGNDAAGL